MPRRRCRIVVVEVDDPVASAPAAAPTAAPAAAPAAVASAPAPAPAAAPLLLMLPGHMATAQAQEPAAKRHMGVDAHLRSTQTGAACPRKEPGCLQMVAEAPALMPSFRPEPLMFEKTFDAPTFNVRNGGHSLRPVKQLATRAARRRLDGTHPLAPRRLPGTSLEYVCFQHDDVEVWAPHGGHLRDPAARSFCVPDSEQSDPDAVSRFRSSARPAFAWGSHHPLGRSVASTHRPPTPTGAAAQRLALGLLLTPRAPAELIVSPDVLETIGQQLVGYDHETECTKWNDQGQEAMEARAQFVPLPQDCLWETAADAAMRSVGWYWHGPEKRAVGFLMEGSKIPTADERQMRLGSYDGIYRVVHEHNGWPILSNQAGLFCYPTLVDEWKSFRPHSQEEPNGAEAVRWCLAPTWRSCGPNCPPTPGRIFDAVLSRGERGDTVEQPNGEDVELTTLYPLCVPDYTAEPSLAMGEHVWEYRDGSMMEWFGHKLTTSLLMDEEQADEAEASLPVYDAGILGLEQLHQ